VTVDQVCQVLEQLAPTRWAESWDNVGLLLGDRRAAAARVMTCLTVTPSVAGEAVETGVNLVVAHHPLPFRPLKSITTDSDPGHLLWQLAGAGVSLYSAHTAFDSTHCGINQMWAESLGLRDIAPLVDGETDDSPGSGRLGVLPEPQAAAAVVRRCAQNVQADGAVRVVGPVDQPVRTVAFACGSGGSFISAAKARGCDLLITGEATFHSCLEAESSGICLGLLGHYHSERFAMERLAEQLSEALPALTIWPSRRETDPIRTV